MNNSTPHPITPSSGHQLRHEAILHTEAHMYLDVFLAHTSTAHLPRLSGTVDIRLARDFIAVFAPPFVAVLTASIPDAIQALYQ